MLMAFSQGVLRMGRLACVFRNTVCRLFRQRPARQAPRPRNVLLMLEALESRLVPSGAGQGGGTLGMAHSVSVATGTYTLNNNGFLTFTPTAGAAVAIDRQCAAFNID